MSEYIPRPDDVEAAADAMILLNARTPGHPLTSYERAKIVAQTLHAARGWRDAGEAQAIENERNMLRGILMAAGFVYTEGAEIPWKPPVNESAGANWRKLIEAEKERDAARAEVEAMRKEVEDADIAISLIEHTAMEEGGFDPVAWAQRNNGLTRKLAAMTADRDALAERCRVAEAEREKFYHEYRLASDVQSKAAIVRADKAEARAARLLAVLVRVDRFIRNGIEFGYIRMPTTECDPALEVPGLVESALAAADTGEGRGE